MMKISRRIACLLPVVLIMTAISFSLPITAQDNPDSTPTAETSVAQRSTPTATAAPFDELTGGEWTLYRLSVGTYGVDGIELIDDSIDSKSTTLDVTVDGDTLTLTGVTSTLFPDFMSEAMPDTLDLTTDDGVNYRVDLDTYNGDNGGYALRLELTRVSETQFTAIVWANVFEFNFMADFILATDNPDDDLRDEMTRCKGAPTPRLAEGDTGVVLYGQGYNNMRSEPGLASAKVGRIPEGDTFQVLSGPVCQDGYAWYEVKHKNDSGWTAEGEDDTYWIWKRHIVMEQ